jgi:hypothetical protein
MQETAGWSVETSVPGHDWAPTCTVVHEMSLRPPMQISEMAMPAP